MDATFGPEWSASLRRVTPDELSDWLALALACCDLADRQALDAFRSQFTSAGPDAVLETAARHFREQNNPPPRSV